MKIIVINGQGGVGKDTFVEMCQKHTSYVFNVSTIDPIKTIASKVGWKGGKTQRDRRFLSDLKDLLTQYNDYPFTKTEKYIEDCLWDFHYYNILTKDVVFFIHCREPEEIDRWVKQHNARTLIIRRRGVEGEYDNHADNNVFNMPYNYTIYNEEGLEDLDRQAKKFIEILKEENWESEMNFKF